MSLHPQQDSHKLLPMMSRAAIKCRINPQCRGPSIIKLLHFLSTPTCPTWGLPWSTPNISTASQGNNTTINPICHSTYDNILSTSPDWETSKQYVYGVNDLNPSQGRQESVNAGVSVSGPPWGSLPWLYCPGYYTPGVSRAINTFTVHSTSILGIYICT